MTESVISPANRAALGQNSQAIRAFLLQFAPFQHMEAAHGMTQLSMQWLLLSLP